MNLWNFKLYLFNHYFFIFLINGQIIHYYLTIKLNMLFLIIQNYLMYFQFILYTYDSLMLSLDLKSHFINFILSILISYSLFLLFIINMAPCLLTNLLIIYLNFLFIINNVYLIFSIFLKVTFNLIYHFFIRKVSSFIEI